MIRDAVEKNNLEGLLVVADSVDRLDSYLHQSFDQEHADVLQRYSVQIMALSPFGLWPLAFCPAMWYNQGGDAGVPPPCWGVKPP